MLVKEKTYFIQASFKINKIDGLITYLKEIKYSCINKTNEIPNWFFDNSIDIENIKLFDFFEYDKPVIILKYISKNSTEFYRWYSELEPYIIDGVVDTVITSDGAIPESFQDNTLYKIKNIIK